MNKCMNMCDSYKKAMNECMCMYMFIFNPINACSGFLCECVSMLGYVNNRCLLALTALICKCN